MKIAHLTVDTDVLLAPMAAVTDLPFRTICEEHGVGLTITEFLSANALCAGAKKELAKLTASIGGRRFGVQIFGREPEALAHAAHLARDIGAALVDINMGCPAKRVVAGLCGSALMREPTLAQDLVRAVRAALPTDIPVTVKHRAGWDDRHLNAPEFACAMVEAGAAMVTVHGRTRTQGFSGASSLDIIRKVRQAVPQHIPVVGNGDVKTLEDYIRMRVETGCDAVMIGRGALGNPWLFRDIRAWLNGQEPQGQPSLIERREVFLRHVDLMRSHTPEKKIIHELRKAVAWYTKGLPDSAGLRDQAQAPKDPDALIANTARYFAERAQHGPRRRTPSAEAACDNSVTSVASSDTVAGVPTAASTVAA